MREGWKTVRLGDVCTIDKVKHDGAPLPYIGLEHIESDTGKYLGDLSPVEVKSATFGFSPDHVLYGRLRPYLNKVMLPEFSGHCSSEIFPLKPREALDRRFLYYWITQHSVVKEIDKTSTGARMPRANVNQVMGFELALPPVEEQKRIVAILDEAFEGIDTVVANTEKNLVNAREIFESSLHLLLSSKAGGWTSSKIGEMVEKGILKKPLDGNHGAIHPKKADYVVDGVPFIMAADLIDGHVDQAGCNFIARDQADSLRKGFALDGDVLLSHKGTIGRAAVLETKHDYVMLTPQVTYYRVADAVVIYNRFLYYAFQSPDFVREIKHVAGAGSTRAYIGITKQLELPLSYPPIEKQKEIVSKLDSINEEARRLQAIYQQKLTALAELKQSLLQKAFSGELTAERAEAAVEEVTA